MQSIWEKTFGKFNHKRDVIRQLSEELINYKNEFNYQSIAKSIVAIGKNYDYAMRLDKPRQIYSLWREADDLGVLDKAVVRAIEHQNGHDDDDDGGIVARQSLLTTQLNVANMNNFKWNFGRSLVSREDLT